MIASQRYVLQLRSTIGLVRSVARKSENGSDGRRISRRSRRVDVILLGLSFSQDIGPASRVMIQELHKAMNSAVKRDVLVFSPVDGFAMSKSKRATEPINLERVFQIGAAKWSDNIQLPAPEYANFTLPGEDPSIKMSGNSVATALAAGLASLILYCVESCRLKKEFRVDHIGSRQMMNIFTSLMDLKSSKSISAERLSEEPGDPHNSWEQIERIFNIVQMAKD